MKQNRIEWGFIALMIALCATLTALQYRWTGEVARAELERLRSHLGVPIKGLCQDFDAELAYSCAQLLPTAASIDKEGREAAHVERLRQWLAGNPRPLFKRMAVVVRAGSTLELRELKLRTAETAPMEWPSEWSEMRENFTRRLTKPGGARYASADGMLLNFALFGGPRSTGGVNLGWLILELDPAYLRHSWLPGLANKYLTSEDGMVVRTASTPSTVIYPEGNAQPIKGEPQVAVKFNHLGHGEGEAAGPPESERWVLEVHQKPGALEAVVASARQRNLAVAIVVNVLILASGGLLVRHTRKSRQLAEAQMSFVANVSHELRTPLTVIRGAAHNLKRGVVQEPERVEQYAGLILQHVEQLTGMIEQVLEHAGAQTNPNALRSHLVSLDEVLRESIMATETDTQAAHCEVSLDLPANLPTLKGDAAALRRVFQNLITNAAKHGGEGGWIGVSATSTNDSSRPMIEVKVVDCGPGIPAHEQVEIFKPFFRGMAAQERQVRGSGLGLGLVRQIVEAHNGRISVSSEGGHGATFIVRLPALNPSSPS